MNEEENENIVTEQFEYTPTEWEDRAVEYPNRYKDQNNNIYEFTQQPGAVQKEGTLVEAEKMNNIEKGIKRLYNAKVNEISENSTDEQYPSAKAVYDLFNSIIDGDEVSW